ncbi:hypothetical protein PV04_10337 [Phialophora macrospora]|uniref:Uncharacterized protein n=1 Tax=Phialophora macrospora TaxID=1851006 RepID=A0A0D2CEK5_9EURO|nr:hypothetical protein PV04_10337 [Phialophora macrospora]
MQSRPSWSGLHGLPDCARRRVHATAGTHKHGQESRLNAAQDRRAVGHTNLRSRHGGEAKDRRRRTGTQAVKGPRGARINQYEGRTDESQQLPVNSICPPPNGAVEVTPVALANASAPTPLQQPASRIMITDLLKHQDEKLLRPDLRARPTNLLSALVVSAPLFNTPIFHTPLLNAPPVDATPVSTPLSWYNEPDMPTNDLDHEKGSCMVRSLKAGRFRLHWSREFGDHFNQSVADGLCPRKKQGRELHLLYRSSPFRDHVLHKAV